MQAGDPFAPFFAALRNFNELMLRGGGGPWAEAYARNLDAIEKANRVIMDGAVEASRRQAEIVRASLEDVRKAAEATFQGGTPSSMAQSELITRSVDAAIERMRGINETLAKANMEALEVLRARLLSSFEEMYGPKK